MEKLSTGNCEFLGKSQAFSLGFEFNQRTINAPLTTSPQADVG